MTPNIEINKNIKDLTLLFVEDDIDLSRQMQNIFNELFKNVTSASNGKLGIDAFKNKLKKDKEPYDLVITDIDMPVMNGIDMIKDIYKVTPEQPIMVMSAYYDSKYLIDLLHVGVNDFLLKPLTTENMCKSLNKITQVIINDRLVKKHSFEKEKLIEELHLKNVALERSLRIIEGLHNKEQINKNTNITIEHHAKKHKIIKKEIDKKEHSQEKESLEKIEHIISEIYIKYNFNGTENELLKTLSKEIKHYANLLDSRESYENLKKSFKLLANAVSNRPKYTKEKEIKHIFTIIESFFYIYTRWQEDWSNMSDKKIKISSHAIENEINTIIEIWNCKI